MTFSYIHTGVMSQRQIRNDLQLFQNTQGTGYEEWRDVNWWLYAWKYSFLLLNSLWPSDAIQWQKSGSTLAQVMASCLTAPSHYLNQCWLFISKVLWHTIDSNFTSNAQATFKTIATSLHAPNDIMNLINPTASQTDMKVIFVGGKTPNLTFQSIFSQLSSKQRKYQTSALLILFVTKLQSPPVCFSHYDTFTICRSRTPKPVWRRYRSWSLSELADMFM